MDDFEVMAIRVNCAHEIARMVQNKLLTVDKISSKVAIEVYGWDVGLEISRPTTTHPKLHEVSITTTLSLDECRRIAEEIYRSLR